MPGAWLSKEDHDKLEQFLDHFAVGENPRLNASIFDSSIDFALRRTGLGPRSQSGKLILKRAPFFIWRKQKETKASFLTYDIN
jgi:hypothetical protein